MNTSRLGALFVLAVLLHNLEEAIWLPTWSQSADHWHQPVTVLVFAFAVTVLSVLLVSLAYLSMRYGQQSISAYLFAGYVFAMVANSLVPHVAVTAITRSYMPGTVTAVLFNAPIGSLLLRRLLVTDTVSLHRMYWCAPLVALALLASIPLLFWIGNRLLG